MQPFLAQNPGAAFIGCRSNSRSPVLSGLAVQIGANGSALPDWLDIKAAGPGCVHIGSTMQSSHAFFHLHETVSPSVLSLFARSSH